MWRSKPFTPSLAGDLKNLKPASTSTLLLVFIAHCSFFVFFDRIFLRDNPAELFGKHVYDLKAYGLNPDKISQVWDGPIMSELPATPGSTPVSERQISKMAKDMEVLTEAANNEK